MRIQTCCCSEAEFVDEQRAIVAVREIDIINPALADGLKLGVQRAEGIYQGEASYFYHVRIIAVSPEIDVQPCPCRILHKMAHTRQSKQADDCSPLIAAAERGEVELTALSRGQYPGTKLKHGVLPGLRTIGYWSAVGSQSWGLPVHRNEGIEICYMLNGETAFGTDHGSWTLRSGDIAVTRPWQRHYLGDPYIRPCKLFWMILDVESSQEHAIWEFPDWVGADAKSRRELLRIFRKSKSCYLADTDKLFGQFMRETCEKLSDDGSLQVAQLANRMNSLLLTVAEGLNRSIEGPAQDHSGFDQTIRQFFEGLEASVEKAAEPWTVSSMAHVCRVGKSYLTASSKRIYNATPAEQLTYTRLAHARIMLSREPNRSITEVAFTTGFNSSQYFANQFKKHIGLTPGNYRKGQMVES